MIVPIQIRRLATIVKARATLRATVQTKVTKTPGRVTSAVRLDTSRGNAMLPRPSHEVTTCVTGIPIHMIPLVLNDRTWRRSGLRGWSAVDQPSPSTINDFRSSVLMQWRTTCVYFVRYRLLCCEIQLF